ncbi:MAG: hypothetical protein WCJ56_10365 [bacterium]
MIEFYYNLVSVLGILAQPLYTTLPIALIIYYSNYEKSAWVKGEFLLSFMPWTVVMLFTAKWGDRHDLGDVIVAGIIGGFVLLPRLFATPETPRAKFVKSLKFAITMTFIALIAVHIANIMYIRD